MTQLLWTLLVSIGVVVAGIYVYNHLKFRGA